MSEQSKWIGPIATIALSAVGGVIFYLFWMVMAIPLSRLDNSLLSAILWILAPLITALGFAGGAAIAERRFRGGQNRYWRIYIWPLIGCSAGATSTYIFGPMLIVFGMLFLGTASIALREIWMRSGKRKSI
ncbi:MAG TPA: hypothetical protein VFI27_04665 [candidate division Zixibacteria bacterium]|nr:hypothetical protein [candidate division Zixibacteria bacterium]